MSNVLHTPTPDRRAPAGARPNPLAGLWREVVRICQLAFAASHHQAIDDATLRDLGMSRSELGSYAAEASGQVEVTRLRVMAARGIRTNHPDRGAFE